MGQGFRDQGGGSGVTRPESDCVQEVYLMGGVVNP